jgi:succinate dehydrogenase hydrophobic anchor subunit
VLHDPPPGYHPPRPRISLKDRQRKAREDWVLMRVATVILVLAAAAIVVIMVVMIVEYH